jgi:hypothetical protein
VKEQTAVARIAVAGSAAAKTASPRVRDRDIPSSATKESRPAKKLKSRRSAKKPKRTKAEKKRHAAQQSANNMAASKPISIRGHTARPEGEVVVEKKVIRGRGVPTASSAKPKKIHGRGKTSKKLNKQAGSSVRLRAVLLVFSLSPLLTPHLPLSPPSFVCAQRTNDAPQQQQQQQEQKVKLTKAEQKQKEKAEHREKVRARKAQREKDKAEGKRGRKRDRSSIENSHRMVGTPGKKKAKAHGPYLASRKMTPTGERSNPNAVCPAWAEKPALKKQIEKQLAPGAPKGHDLFAPPKKTTDNQGTRSTLPPFTAYRIIPAAHRTSPPPALPSPRSQLFSARRIRSGETARRSGNSEAVSINCVVSRKPT